MLPKECIIYNDWIGHTVIHQIVEINIIINLSKYKKMWFMFNLTCRTNINYNDHANILTVRFNQ